MTTVYPEQSVRLAELVAQAAALVEQLGRQAEAERRAFEEGYRLGLAAGVDVGQAREQAFEEERAAAQAEAIDRYSRVRSLEELQALQYPTYTAEQLRKLRGRDRYPLPDRLCSRCDGRGFIPGGMA